MVTRGVVGGVGMGMESVRRRVLVNVMGAGEGMEEEGYWGGGGGVERVRGGRRVEEEGLGEGVFSVESAQVVE